MGFLEKMGLIERAEEETIDYDLTQYEEMEEELPEVNVEGVTQGDLRENLIAEIYNANELFDMSNSIFKVEEISKSLPATMTTEAKKASVIGILSSFNLTVEGLVEDASKRIDTLRAVSVQVNDNNMEIINAKKQEIEDAKKLIEKCEKTIAEHEQVIATSTDLIEDEVKRIAGLKEFLGGK